MSAVAYGVRSRQPSGVAVAVPWLLLGTTVAMVTRCSHAPSTSG